MIETDNPLLDRLTIRERPDSMTFRCWQAGPGYDRNMRTNEALAAAIECIHMNPIRRGQMKRASDWKWSSPCWYESNRKVIAADLPTIGGFPWSFLLDPRPNR